MVQWFYQGQGHLQFLHNFFLIHVVEYIYDNNSPPYVTGNMAAHP